MLVNGFTTWLLDGPDELYAGDPSFFEFLADLVTRKDYKAQIAIWCVSSRDAAITRHQSGTARISVTRCGAYRDDQVAHLGHNSLSSTVGGRDRRGVGCMVRVGDAFELRKESRAAPWRSRPGSGSVCQQTGTQRLLCARRVSGH